jgi:NADH dehydrogenase (ubiquinone) 1 alpha subcomplex subunit 9
MSVQAAGVYKWHGGRSSVSNVTATVFGANGFLGRYVVNRIGKKGSRVLCPFRGDEMWNRHLKPMGDLGAINFYNMSIRKVEDIEAAVAGSNVVINLLGKHVETTRFSFQDLHATFPSVLATICAEQGVERFIHVSALGASVDSPSKWARSKAVGEQAIFEAFPGATILRPATVFGDEDRFLNRIAKLSQSLPLYPLIMPEAKKQPVYADDVAAAIEKCVVDPTTAGQTYSLAGPKVYTMKEVTDYVYDIIGEDSNAVHVPNSVGMALGFGIQQLPDAWMTVDDLRLQSTDVVMPAGELGLADLGITSPSTMEDIGERYLVRFRKSSAFIERDGEEAKVVRQPQI